jgi:hypothetical protein
MLVVCDLDGVLANFTKGACELHGYPDHLVTEWDWYKRDWGMTDAQFWLPIKHAGYNFYAGYVDPYPWIDEILDLVRRFNWVLATATPDHPELVASKVDWINKYIGKSTPTMIGNFKDLLAKERRLLIDDSDDNVKAFRARSGLALTFPQLWNGAAKYVRDPVNHIRTGLDYYDYLLRNESA